MTRAGTGENTHSRATDRTSPVDSVSGTGSQVVPFGQLESLQQMSVQIPVALSQMLLRHCALLVHAWPEMRVAVALEGRQTGRTLTIGEPPLEYPVLAFGPAIEQVPEPHSLLRQQGSTQTPF